MYDENGIRLIRTDPDKEDKENGCCDIFYLKNDSSDILYVGSKDCSVNDFMLDEMGGSIIYSSRIDPGETAVMMAEVDSYSLQYLMNTEEDVKIESLECTIFISKMAEMYGYWTPDEEIAEIPYTYTAE